ncbi:pdz and lim domain protein 1 [Lasius niger]|uniref:Pdz and lim domain protein 1 n=1 Tax=Lasius niger TaxID=67767 RepID=A0A0J7L0R6_LASNI|nr:pdz and lim domain protein 1 [Lasius niger]
MAISIKFTKFDNTSWGFRLAGGSDFPQPLTVIRITEGSLAECMGLKVGDVVVRLNDQPISSLTHGQAHEALVHAGNNFVLAVQREEEARKAVEAISEENIVPYKIALADLPPVFPEQILKEETVIERYEEEKTVVEPLSVEDEVRREEEKLAEEKPVDADSEIVPNKNLTDDEIAQLILEEEELLSDKGLLGVNFKKLRPRAPILKDSKVLEELQHIATAEPERTQELKRTSTFLQRPQRPVPKTKCEEKVAEEDGESYRVVIKKQDKKTVIARLVEKGLLPPGSEASVAGTPEPPEESSEVKMHETENRKIEEDRPPSVVFHPNSSCSISPFDDPLSPSRSPRLDSNEAHPSFEDQLERSATYKCKSKQFNVRPNHYRRYSSADEAGTRSPFKARYLENVLCGFARSCVSRDRQIDDRFELARTKSGSFCFSELGFDCLATTSRRRTSRCPRAHYAERILLRNVSSIARHFRSKPKTTQGIVASRIKRNRTKGRYLATCLRRESARLVSLMTTLFQFLLQRSSVSESSSTSEIRKRRLSYRGRYLKHVLQKNVAPVLQRVKKTHLIGDYPNTIEERKDEPKSTRTKGHYVEKCLYRQNLYLKSALANLLGYTKTSFGNLFTLASSSRVKRATRGRYFERFVRRNLEILELFAEYVCIKFSEWLEEGPSCISKKEFSVVASNYIIAGDSVLDEQKIDEDDCDVKICGWHEDGPSCSLQEESTVIVDTPDNLDHSNKEETEENDVLECNDNPILSDEVEEDERSVSSKIPEREDTFSTFLQSTENYISTEVFHRGSRRLSRSRKSIDIVPEKDDNTFSKYLQSAENYVSAEVFHRGSRRLSRSFKDAERETGVLSGLLHSTGDYVSSEVFHRGSRRLSRSSRRESVSLVTPDTKSVYFNLPWFSLRVSNKSVERRGDCEEKIDSEIERDNRRLSFVPTILYQSITNRIGVDFTRLVAYAFVPCTSIILLYMYK